MNLLVKKDTGGSILEGTEQRLLDRAAGGDDLTIYIESTDYDEFIIFGNYVVNAGRVCGLSLPHLNHGDLSDAERLTQEPITTVQYIYDSDANNLIAKDALDQGETQTTLFFQNPSYRSYAWYSTRSYVEAHFTDLERLVACGDQFKVRLDFSDDFKVIVKPDIIYFPDQGRDYLVKSSAMLLPTPFVNDPLRCVAAGRPILSNEEFSLTYLNVGSDGRVTIIHKQRFMADRKVSGRVLEGTVSHSAEGPTMVTQVQCEHAILIPDGKL